MCTVTFCNGSQGVIITSNRDERNNRPMANEVRREEVGGDVLFYPLDPLAFGTWFGCRNDRSAMVLLNGAFEKHLPNGPYQRSRGVVLLDMLREKDFGQAWTDVVLAGVEPFTLVCYQNHDLVVRRWDAEVKHSETLDAKGFYIWSSVTLYDRAIRAEREQWFEEFLSQNRHGKDADDLMQFHTLAGANDVSNALVMNRDNEKFTKNITQCAFGVMGHSMIHRELVSHRDLQFEF